VFPSIVRTLRAQSERRAEAYDPVAFWCGASLSVVSIFLPKLDTIGRTCRHFRLRYLAYSSRARRCSHVWYRACQKLLLRPLLYGVSGMREQTRKVGNLTNQSWGALIQLSSSNNFHRWFHDISKLSSKRWAQVQRRWPQLFWSGRSERQETRKSGTALRFTTMAGLP
jgi:hypothetical protein